MKLSEKSQANMKQIQALEDKYSLTVFRMALSHLFDVGHANFDKVSIEKMFKQISEYEETVKTTDEKSMLTPDLQREILECAVELSAFSILTLFAYIKKHLYIKI